MRIALSAMTCSRDGVSESLVAYNWLHQIAQHHTVDLITADSQQPLLENVSTHFVSNEWWPLRFVSDELRSAVKPDYFLFDRRSGKQCANIVAQSDIFHHVVPQAPRYPSSLGRQAKRFVLGPIGGGLRVPEAFRELVEDSEPLFARLRRFDSLRFRHDPWLRATYQAANVILLTAPYMLDILPEEFHSKVEFIAETGIDSDAYHGESSDRPNSGKTIVLYVGRITPYKGLEFLLRALAKLPGEIIKNTRAHIVGAGESNYEKRCREITAQLHLADHVIFHGRCSKRAVLEHYRRAHIFCFPTLAETTGNVLLEAMAMGLPTVSTNYGGPAAVVDSKSGILVNPESPESFSAGIAEALQGLILNGDLRKTIGAHARQHVLKTLSWHSKGEQISDVYDRLVRGIKSH